MNLRHCLAAFAVVLLVGCGAQSGPKFEATDVTGADFGRNFTLPDQNG